MHTPTLVASVLLAATAAAGVSLMLRPTDAITAGGDSAAHDIVELRQQIDALRQELAARAVPAATAAASGERTAVASPSPESIAAAVEAYLAQRPASGPAKATDAGAEPGVLRPIDAVYADLAGTSFWQNGAAWKQAFADGRMDELIAKFEADAKANPNDAKKQMALANAYLSYLQLDQSKWQLSDKADKTFDKVLAIDDHHWEARFSKAVSYTFWPDFLGKKGAAIENFQILVEQQESMPVTESQAQTYLYLGNLLEAKDPAKAREIWQRGLTRHPDNEELRKRIGQ